MECIADTILPCPFCGSHSTVLKERCGAYTVTCQSCGGTGPTETLEDCAVDSWNARAALAASFRATAIH